MPVAGGGFAQAYNAQATVTVGSLLIIGAHVTQHPNDQQEIEPALAALAQLPTTLGVIVGLNADNGYLSEGNVNPVVKAGIEPLIALGRPSHHEALAERLAPVPAPPENPTALQAMQHRLKTPEGKARYAQRKTTSEPVFGIIKEVMGFRRFFLRGLDKVKGEWRWVCLAYNLKRLCILNQGVMTS